MKVGTIFLVSRILYPKYNPVWFLFYMYFKYHSILKREFKYSVETLSDNVLWNIITIYPRSNCDINNCVIVHPENIYTDDRILSMYDYGSRTLRKVIVVPDPLCEKHKCYVSNNYFYNAVLTPIDLHIKLVKAAFNVECAEEVELSLIASPYDVSPAMIDLIIEAYFTLPKLVCKGDLISINIKHFAGASFYMDQKLNAIENLYFKCHKVMFSGREVAEQYFCLIGQTSIKQVVNVQSFLPKVKKIGTNVVLTGFRTLAEVNVCPCGLNKYLEMLRLAIYNFLNTKNLQLRPLFLLEGEEGCGEDILVRSLALESGMHHFMLNNSDFSANVYAQNESKLNNIFFAAKLSAPCIISIHKFQNFGKNPEGQYDERLINSFIDSLDNLFDSNPFPVILFCCTSSKQIPSEFKRAFLETFEIAVPTDTEREQILRWVIEKNSIQLEGVNLGTVSNKTHGFYFEDLEALVYFAKRNNVYKSSMATAEVILEQDDFEKAIDAMQSNYNETLGAPKVPNVQWSDVGGLNAIKGGILKTINLPLRHADMFTNSGLARSGILLFGPPGTGKTLLAKAVATECSLCFLTVKGPELLNMYVGQSEQNVREVFERARQASPCIIFFDELDSLAPNRGLSGDSGGVMDRVVSQLLAEMDGLDGIGKVFIIGATNRPDLIDPALLRPGRFDKLLYVGPCGDLDAKISVVQALTRKYKLSEDVNLEELVTSCPQNMTGADFYGICANAWTGAAKRLVQRIEKDGLSTTKVFNQDVIVDIRDFTVAIENIQPSISKEDLTYFENLGNELISFNNTVNK